MTTIAEAAQELTDALEAAAIQGLRVHSDIGPGVSPPCVVLGPPALRWEGYGSAPTSARWLVYVVVPLGDRALPQLWDLVPAVSAALDSVPDATVQEALPGTYPSSGGDLPCYEIQVECAL